MSTRPSVVTQEQADALDWYHSIGLGNGVITRGTSDTVPLQGEQFPDVSGKSVIDIGAWDGYYSFESERRGAKRVVALDHYVWSIDWAARQAYWDECRDRAVLPNLDRDEHDFWLEDLPGKAPFDFAHRALNSAVESVVADFMTVELETIGIFDVALYLGVLYHMPEPFTALRRIRQVTGEVAVIETVAIRVSGHEEQPLAAFYGGDELSGDYGNWYALSERALHAMCRAAGFSRVETKGTLPYTTGSPPSPPPGSVRRSWPQGLRQRLRLRSEAPPPRQLSEPPRFEVYRAVVHAFV